jgi:hypothetical protein
MGQTKKRVFIQQQRQTNQNCTSVRHFQIWTRTFASFFEQIETAGGVDVLNPQ